MFLGELMRPPNSMQEDLEHIYRLLQKEAEGTISPEELAYLDELSREDPYVRERRQFLREDEVGTRDALRAAEEITPESLLGEYKRRQRKKLYTMATAACVILLAGFFWYQYSENTPSALMAKRIAAIEPTPVELKFTSGEIRLLEENQNFYSGKANFVNEPPKLMQASPGNPDESAIVVTPGGKDYSVILEDSSTVQLNSESSLRFPLSFRGKGRRVEMTGEAYFNIKGDAERPFIVQVPNAVIEVLGTEFNVQAYDSVETRISLVSGSLRVRFGGRSFLVEPGTELVIKAGTDMHLVPFDKSVRLSWLKGVYVFHAENMREVLKVARRWYGIDIVVDNAALFTRKYTGFIDRKDPVTVFLDNFRETGTFDYFLDDKNILHLY